MKIKRVLNNWSHGSNFLHMKMGLGANRSGKID